MIVPITYRVTGSLQRVSFKDKASLCLFVGLYPLPNDLKAIEFLNKEEPTELTPEDRKEIQEFITQNKGKELDALAELVSPSVIGHEDIKKGLLMSAVNSGKDSFKNKRRINILIIGPPGLAKTILAKDSTRLGDQNSQFASATDATTSSLIGVVDKDTGYFNIGPVPMANNAICSIDEVGYMPPEDQKRLLSALEHGIIYFGRFGLFRNLEASASFVLTSNPASNSGRFRDPRKVDHNELPFIGALIDRVDLVFIVNIDRTDWSDACDYANDWLDKMDKYDAIVEEEDKNFEFLRKHNLCAREHDPKFSSEIKHRLGPFYANIITSKNSWASPTTKTVT